MFSAENSKFALQIKKIKPVFIKRHMLKNQLPFNSVTSWQDHMTTQKKIGGCFWSTFRSSSCVAFTEDVLHAGDSFGSGNPACLDDTSPSRSHGQRPTAPTRAKKFQQQQQHEPKSFSNSNRRLRVSAISAPHTKFAYRNKVKTSVR